jgi:hypothetical protein
MAIQFAQAMHFVAEPAPPCDYARRSRQRQLARVLCRLYDELHGRYPRLRMTSRAMIDCLVYNGFGEDVLDSSDLENQMLALLKNIRNRANAQLRLSYCFTRCDGITPLFPSEEPFDEWDTFRFCQVLLQHLERERNRGSEGGWTA